MAKKTAKGSKGSKALEKAQNHLFYGDNLTLLNQGVVEDESIDLVYLDPPFNSARDYNVLFQEKDGSKSAAQIKAFEDTWEWNTEAAAAYHAVVEEGGKVSEVMQAFKKMLGESDMLAYLAMMAPRLKRLYETLKDSGTLWLHCDPTASHYLKALLDAVFANGLYLNEIIWKRSSAHSDAKQGMKRCGKIHDTLLVYAKSPEYTWNTIYTDYTDEYLASEYKHVDKDGRYYKETDLTAAKPGGDVSYEWRVKRKLGTLEWGADLDDEWERKPKKNWEYFGVPPYENRYWAYKKENIKEFAKSGNLIHRKTGMPRLVQYADEMPGIPLQDLWDDIPPASGDESLGYPTQKPIALLERVIMASTNPGDTVLDAFCGCGTTIAAASKLDRKWVGMDITHLAINLIKSRLIEMYGKNVSFDVVGAPTTLEGAEELAHSDPYGFQWWAAGLVGARGIDKKKGADKGIDGRMYIHDGTGAGKTHQIILSVKAGQLQATYVRDLAGVVQREKADIGVMISFETPTKKMYTEAASHGFYTSAWGTHPKIQLLTIEDLLNGADISRPQTAGINKTFKTAKKVGTGKSKDKKHVDQETLF